jgi:hypothetical protein
MFLITNSMPSKATSRHISDSGGLARSGVLGVILGRHTEANIRRSILSHLHQILSRQFNAQHSLQHG